MASGNGYVCNRCGKANSDWETFETGWPGNVKSWCLGHVPWFTRVKMRLKGID